MSNETKLSPHTTWLFAFGSIAAGIAASYALQGLGTKVTAAVYFAVVAIGGFASTYLTRARTGGAIAAFAVGSIVAAIGYFELIQHVFTAATTTMADATQTGAAHAQTVDAGAQMGTTFGVMVAAIVFLETIVAGIGGAIAGAKSRGAGGVAALSSLAKSAR